MSKIQSEIDKLIEKKALELYSFLQDNYPITWIDLQLQTKYPMSSLVKLINILRKKKLVGISICYNKHIKKLDDCVVVLP